MSPPSKSEALDRHVLAVAIWLAFGFVAVILCDYGLGSGGALFVLAGSAVILAAFIAHVIVNAVYRTTFTRRELAFGLVVFAAALVAFGLATLFNPSFAARNFLPVSLGFIAVSASVLFYMITHFGVRRVFDAFDVVRDFSPRHDDDISPPMGGRR
jgi:hypothetical protein